jgi:hypothetical protein
MKLIIRMNITISLFFLKISKAFYLIGKAIPYLKSENDAMFDELLCEN